MKKIEAFVRHEALEAIRGEMVERGIPSLSITDVKGSGRQRGVVVRQSHKADEIPAGT